MSYKVVLTNSFKRSIKRLKKRYRHVKDDVRLAIKALLVTPELGILITFEARKLRVRNSDLKKGKSGGYRLLYFVSEEPEPTIYLLLLYAKSDKDNVTQQELQELLEEIEECNM